MNLTRSLVPVSIVGMLALAAFPWIEGDLQAASSPVGSYQPNLLVTAFPRVPRFDQIARLDHAVIASYGVEKPDSLWEFCRRNGLDAFTVRSSNSLDVQILEPGTVLRIPNRKGTLYQVQQPETLHVISQGFARGRLLGKVYEQEILSVNGYPPPDFLSTDLAFQAGTELFLPDAFKPTGLGFPFVDMQFRQTSRFGKRRHPVLGVVREHSGLDLAKPYGSPVMTAREGVVTFAGWQGGYGMMVEVRHQIKRKDGVRVLYTRYGHLSKILVQEGQIVRHYQLVGRVGSTGISTGPHLHFEVRDEGGRARNPANFL